MRKLSIAFFSGILLAAPLAPLSAQNVLISGNAMNANSGMTTALTSLGASYTVVSPFDFGTTSFTGYNVIWLDGFSQYSPGTPGNPGLVSANLISFMDTGGVVFVQNPGFGSERFAAYPFGSELGASFSGSSGPDNIRITDSLNPANAGLTGSALSGWNPSAYGIINSDIGSFTGVTDTGNNGEWVSVVRQVGNGELVYTEQGISQRLDAAPNDPGAVQFLGNVIGMATPEPSSVVLMAAGVALVVARRLRR